MKKTKVTFTFTLDEDGEIYEVSINTKETSALTLLTGIVPCMQQLFIGMGCTPKQFKEMLCNIADMAIEGTEVTKNDIRRG